MPAPAGLVPGQLPPQQSKIPATLVAPATPSPDPNKVLTTAPRQPEEASAAEKRAAEYGLSRKTVRLQLLL